MKAQVSLDFLVVSLIVLSVLAIWFAGATHTQNTILSAIHTQAERSQAAILTALFNSLCIMGQGNTAQIKIHHSTVVHNTLCPIQTNNFTVGQVITAQNTGNKITIQLQNLP